MIKKLLNLKLKFTKNQKGLTLIELLVVIVILGIIAAIAVPMVMNSSDKAATSANEQNQKIVQDAVNRYYALNPTAVAGSVSDTLLLPGTTALGGPFLDSMPTCEDASGKDLEFEAKDIVVIPKGCAGNL